MKDQVYSNCLQRALDKTLKWYPYMKSGLSERNGDFYYIENLLPCLVRETRTLHSLGSSKTNYHLFEVTFKNKQIFLSFHHALCDGEGIKPFLETLLYYYCSYRYNECCMAAGIRLAGELLLEGETTDPFTAAYAVISDEQTTKYHFDGFQLPETIKPEKEQTIYYRYEVKIQQDEFMKFVKANNATPSIATTLFMSEAIQRLYPDAYMQKPIVCNLASDMRKELHLENTFKNCAHSLSLPFTEELAILSFNEKVKEYRRMLREQREPETVKKEDNRLIALSDKLDTLNGFTEKKKIMSFFDNLFLNTYIISYIGQINLNEFEKYVESVYLYSAGITGLAIDMVCAGGHFTFSIKQSFESDKYAKTFVEVIKGYGLNYTLSDCIPFTTPRDSVQKQLHLLE